MGNQKLKKITLKVFYVTSVVLVIIITVYHNDTTNLIFQNKINTRIEQYLKLNLYSKINSAAHFFDIKGEILSMKHPVTYSNIVDLIIKKKQFSKLIEKKVKWININILINDTLQPAKLKFHGTSLAHYYDGKFSFRIKMENKSKFLNGMKVFNLIKAEEADPTVISANKFASKFGLISSYGKMIMLNINGENWGAYYLVERIAENFLKRKFSIGKYAKLSNVTDWNRKENNFGSNHISDFDLYSGHIENDNSPNHAVALGKYKKMCSYINQNDAQSLTKFFDIEYMGKYLSIMALFNDIHHVSGDNLKLIYDFKSEKFFPIYRQESGSRPIYNVVQTQEDIFFNNYTNFNKMIFHKSLPNYLHATNSAIFKILLSNDSVRNERDKILNQIVKKESNYKSFFKDVYKENLPILYSSNLSRRSQYFNEKQQLEVFSKMCDFAKKYLNYGHVYGSFNISDSTLSMITDAFCQVKISSNENKFKDYLINGIKFDQDLDIFYNYTKIPFKGKNWKMEDLIFINSITKDTIKNIYINELSEDKF
jgi:hypothetical protein